MHILINGSLSCVIASIFDLLTISIYIIKSGRVMRIIINYSRTSWYGHLSNKDTSMLRTVSNVPTKFAYIFFKKTAIIRTLSNTDKGH